jgi:hypothetical protein
MRSPALPNLESERQQSQLAFLASGAELEVGTADACPLPVGELAATRGDEPYVVQTFRSGLTAVVHRLRLGGRDWALKLARPQALVRNVDGQTSFLNEIQRRADLERLKAAPGGRERFAAIVDTQYASLKRGLLLSPWIEGGPVRTWNERTLAQVLGAAVELVLAGLFEWDYCPGNVLDDGMQVRLFDFGYMYRFDPLRHFNSAGNGRDAPQFHAVERFETRSYFGYLLGVEHEQGIDAALTAFRLEKGIALEAYRRLRRELDRRNAVEEILAWIDAIESRWRIALRDDLGALDLADDLHGQTCTPQTLARASWLIEALTANFDALRAHDAFFGIDVRCERATLLDRYRQRLARAKRLQTASRAS